MSNVPEAKSLRWLAIQFPYTKDPKDDTDRLSNAIHLYASAGADCIDRLQAEVDSLRNRDLCEKYRPVLDDLIRTYCQDCAYAVLNGLREEVPGNE